MTSLSPLADHTNHANSSPRPGSHFNLPRRNVKKSTPIKLAAASGSSSPLPCSSLLEDEPTMMLDSEAESDDDMHGTFSSPSRRAATMQHPRASTSIRTAIAHAFSSTTPPSSSSSPFSRAAPAIFFGTPSAAEMRVRNKYAERVRERRLLRRDSLELARRRSVGPQTMDAAAESQEEDKSAEQETDVLDDGRRFGADEEEAKPTSGEETDCEANWTDTSSEEPDAYEMAAMSPVRMANDQSRTTAVAIKALATMIRDGQSNIPEYVQEGFASPRRIFDADGGFTSDDEWLDDDGDVTAFGRQSRAEEDKCEDPTYPKSEQDGSGERTFAQEQKRAGSASDAIPAHQPATGENKHNSNNGNVSISLEVTLAEDGQEHANKISAKSTNDAMKDPLDDTHSSKAEEQPGTPFEAASTIVSKETLQGPDSQHAEDSNDTVLSPEASEASDQVVVIAEEHLAILHHDFARTQSEEVECTPSMTRPEQATAPPITEVSAAPQEDLATNPSTPIRAHVTPMPADPHGACSPKLASRDEISLRRGAQQADNTSLSSDSISSSPGVGRADIDVDGSAYRRRLMLDIIGTPLADMSNSAIMTPRRVDRQRRDHSRSCSPLKCSPRKQPAPNTPAVGDIMSAWARSKCETPFASSPEKHAPGSVDTKRSLMSPQRATVIDATAGEHQVPSVAPSPKLVLPLPESLPTSDVKSRQSSATPLPDQKAHLSDEEDHSSSVPARSRAAPAAASTRTLPGTKPFVPARSTHGTAQSRPAASSSAGPSALIAARAGKVAAQRSMPISVSSSPLTTGVSTFSRLVRPLEQQQQNSHRPITNGPRPAARRIASPTKSTAPSAKLRAPATSASGVPISKLPKPSMGPPSRITKGSVATSVNGARRPAAVAVASSSSMPPKSRPGSASSVSSAGSGGPSRFSAVKNAVRPMPQAVRPIRTMGQVASNEAVVTKAVSSLPRPGLEDQEPTLSQRRGNGDGAPVPMAPKSSALSASISSELRTSQTLPSPVSSGANRNAVQAKPQQEAAKTVGAPQTTDTSQIGHTTPDSPSKARRVNVPSPVKQMVSREEGLSRARRVGLGMSDSRNALVHSTSLPPTPMAAVQCVMPSLPGSAVAPAAARFGFPGASVPQPSIADSCAPRPPRLVMSATAPPSQLSSSHSAPQPQPPLTAKEGSFRSSQTSPVKLAKTILPATKGPSQSPLVASQQLPNRAAEGSAGASSSSSAPKVLRPRTVRAATQSSQDADAGTTTRRSRAVRAGPTAVSQSVTHAHARPPSAEEISRLTSANTRHNEVCLAHKTVKTIRIHAPRPPSPSSKIRRSLSATPRLSGKRAKEARADRAKRRASGEEEEDESGDGQRSGDISRTGSDAHDTPTSTTHRLGPGEEEVYQTPYRLSRNLIPPLPKGVRWAHDLIRNSSETRERTSEADIERSLKPCLLPITRTLDRFGNIVGPSDMESKLRKTKVLVQKYVYDDDE